MRGLVAAFQGRLGFDPKVGTSKKGSRYVRFSVAVDNGGDEDRETQWVSVAYFKADAEELAERLQKGSECYCEGYIRLNEWTQDGEKRAGLSVSAWTVQPMGQIGRRGPQGKGRDADSDSQRSRRSQRDDDGPPHPGSAGGGATGLSADFDDDHIPF